MLLEMRTSNREAAAAAAMAATIVANASENVVAFALRACAKAESSRVDGAVTDRTSYSRAVHMTSCSIIFYLVVMVIDRDITMTHV